MTTTQDILTASLSDNIVTLNVTPRHIHPLLYRQYFSLQRSSAPFLANGYDGILQGLELQQFCTDSPVPSGSSGYLDDATFTDTLPAYGHY